MRTTLNLDDALLQEAMQRYGVRSKTEMIERSLKEIIAADNRRKLAAAFGTEKSIRPVRRRRAASAG